MLNQSPGLFFFGFAPGSIPFQGGTLCVSPPLKRTGSQWSAGNAGPPDCSGTYDLHLSQALMAANGLVAGTIVYGQYYSRDNFARPHNVGLTNAISFAICP